MKPGEARERARYRVVRRPRYVGVRKYAGCAGKCERVKRGIYGDAVWLRMFDGDLVLFDSDELEAA